MFNINCYIFFSSDIVLNDAFLYVSLVRLNVRKVLHISGVESLCI